MSRTGTGSGDVIAVPRTSNIYTVLAAVGLVVVILALIVVWTRGDTMFGGLLSASETPPAVRR